MAEIDPVIVQLRADLQSYRQQMQSTAVLVDNSLNRQERAIMALEAQMRASSGGIASTLRGLAGAFAGAFSAQQLIVLTDSFTRLQNQLSQTGADGEQLKAIQDRLLVSAQRYGVDIEGLAGLFSKVSQASTELGASQEDVFAVTEAVSASLGLAGISAQEASGALLQLGQALRGGKVQAEEYNSLLDGLYPLLEAAAQGSDRWGGSVAKLTADVKAGTVSSREFFEAIVAGSANLQERAANATLTTAQGFTALSNALTIYFGEADKANGVSAALGEALGAVADNLDTLIPAIAAASVALGTGFVVNAARARVATLALGAASVGAAGAVGTLGFAAGRTGAALLTAFGGPVGVTILAVGGALAYTHQRAELLAGATEETARKMDGLLSSADGTALGINNLARGLETATGWAQSFFGWINRATEATGGLTTTLAGALNVFGALRSIGDFLGFGPSRGSKSAPNRGARLTKTGSGAPAAASSASSGRARGTGGSRASGPSAEDIQARFANELTSLAQQTLSARRTLATSAEEEAELALRSVELARQQALSQLEREQDYSASQRQRIADQIEALADAERAAIERDRTIRLEQEANDLREAEVRGQSDALRAQYDLADSAIARQRLALEIFDLEEQERQAVLARTAANEALDTAIRQRAAAELAAAQATAGQRRDAVARGSETPAQAFMRELNRSSGAINEDLDRIAIDGLNNLNDGITDAIMNAEGLGDVFKKVANQIIADLIRIAVQQAIIQPLANSLFGGGGGFGSIFGGLFGRASGGYVAPGQMVRVNEGASRGRVEGFMPTGSGKIVPLGQMNAMRGGSGQAGGIVQVQVSLTEDLNARIDNRAAGVAVSVTRQAAPSIINAAKQETLREAGRARL